MDMSCSIFDIVVSVANWEPPELGHGFTVYPYTQTFDDERVDNPEDCVSCPKCGHRFEPHMEDFDYE